MTSLNSMDRVPGAWYDLTARVGSLRAVIGCIAESLPAGNIPSHLMRAFETAHCLAGAAGDLVDLVAADVDRLEQQLKQSSAND